MRCKAKLWKKTAGAACIALLVLGTAACHSKMAQPGTMAMQDSAMAMEKSDTLGEFKATDLHNMSVTQDVFKENDLTLVNVFSSTCNPCMEELPHLAELSEELKEKKIGVLGINIDVDAQGQPDESSRKMVMEILGEKKDSFNAVFPDKALAEKIMPKTDVLPYSFFVDKEGNIIGKSYPGARTKEEWSKLVQSEATKLQGK